MAPRKKPRFWRRCRIYFRRFRIFIWVLILIFLGLLLYVNQVGLPDFVKTPLLARLRARGIDLQFARLRLSWNHGIVAEKVRFGRSDDPQTPRLALEVVQVRLNYEALFHRHLQIESLLLQRGKLIWPVNKTNEAERALSLNGIQTDLRFLPGDQWTLDNFRAEFAGARLQLTGSITNASAWRGEKGVRVSALNKELLRLRLANVADILETIHFSEPPDLRLDLRGDARDFRSMAVWFRLDSAGAETPWGAFSHAHFGARLRALDSNDLSRAEITLTARSARTHWATTTNLQLDLNLKSFARQTNLVEVALTAHSSFVETEWGRATNSEFTGQWIQALNNSTPLSASGQLCSDYAETKWGGAAGLELTGQMVNTLELPTQARENAWGFWARLAPYPFHIHGWVGHSIAPKLELGLLLFGADWQPPRLSVTNFHAEIFNGKLDGTAELNVETRRVNGVLSTDADPANIKTLLTEGGSNWVSQFAWNQPPRVSAHASVTLPAWTNRNPDWRAEVQPTLQLDGHLLAEKGGAYREIPMEFAQSHFTYSNMIWVLPDLEARPPHGILRASLESNDRTKEFHWKIHSQTDVALVRPLLATNQQKALEIITFTEPPVVDGEIWGRWHNPEQIGFRGGLSLTNFSFRGQHADWFKTSAEYANKRLLLTNPALQSGTQYMSATSVIADFESMKLFLTNGVGSFQPEKITRAIGPNIAKIMEPYHFYEPPIARVEGVIPLRHEEDADLHFDLEGGPFEWSKIKASRIKGQAHWVGPHLTLANITATAHQGKAGGSAQIHFIPHEGPDYQFTVSLTNCDLHSLMTDLARENNKLEGLLNGNLTITHGHSTNLDQLEGYGSVNLQDGFLWDTPVFGIFSPVLNGISPGMGNNRASAATGSFTITNGVLRTDDLDIRSSGMRLDYKGSLDWQSHVNARVEAELLRDAWLVGPLVSTIFWPVTKMFEYRVTGSITHPKMEPIYFLPRLVTMPFHPFRTFRELAPEEEKSPPPGPAPAPR